LEQAGRMIDDSSWMVDNLIADVSRSPGFGD
jgi:hypothetical protein